MEMKKWFLNQLAYLSLLVILGIATTGLFVDAIGYEIKFWQILLPTILLGGMVYLIGYNRKNFQIFLLIILLSSLLAIIFYYQTNFFKEWVAQLVFFISRYTIGYNDGYALSFLQELVAYMFFSLIFLTWLYLVLFKFKKTLHIYFIVLGILFYSFYNKVFDNKLALATGIIGFICLYFYRFDYKKKYESIFYSYVTQVIIISTIIVGLAFTFSDFFPRPFAWTDRSNHVAKKAQELKPELDDQLDFSNKLFFTVKSNRAIYMRENVYSNFDGRGWTVKPMDGSEDETGMQWFDRVSSLASKYHIEMEKLVGRTQGEVIYRDYNGKRLIVPDNTYSIETLNEDVEYVYVPETGLYNFKGTQFPYYSFQAYTLKKNQPDFIHFLEEIEKNQGQKNQSDMFYDQYLQLNEDITGRTLDLTMDIVSGYETTYSKAIAIEDYLKSNYKYNYRVILPTEGENTIDFFLFESKEGYCTYFASSMVLMLRSIGIPSRLITGFVLKPDYTGIPSSAINQLLIEEQNPNVTKVYSVRDQHAHAWVEVYFEGFGWVPFEPTSTFDNSFNEGVSSVVPIEIHGDTVVAAGQASEKKFWLFGLVMFIIITVILVMVALIKWMRQSIVDRYLIYFNRIIKRISSLGDSYDESETLREYWQKNENKAFFEHVPVLPFIENYEKWVYGKCEINETYLTQIQEVHNSLKVAVKMAKKVSKSTK